MVVVLLDVEYMDHFPIRNKNTLMVRQDFKSEHANKADIHRMALLDVVNLQRTMITMPINLLRVIVHEYFVRLLHSVPVNIRFRDDVEARIIVHIICNMCGYMLPHFLNSRQVNFNSL